MKRVGHLSILFFAACFTFLSCEQKEKITAFFPLNYGQYSTDSSYQSRNYYRVQKVEDNLAHILGSVHATFHKSKKTPSATYQYKSMNTTPPKYDFVGAIQYEGYLSEVDSWAYDVISKNMLNDNEIPESYNCHPNFYTTIDQTVNKESLAKTDILYKKPRSYISFIDAKNVDQEELLKAWEELKKEVSELNNFVQMSLLKNVNEHTPASIIIDIKLRNTGANKDNLCERIVKIFNDFSPDCAYYSLLTVGTND